VRVEATVLGDSLVTRVVEGNTVMQYTRLQLSSDEGPEGEEHLIGKGYVALQAESHPTDFCTVEILKLAGCTDPQATNYKSYYVAPANSTCTY
jgi:hypothetical protein